MPVAVEFVLAFALIVGGALGFTNAVEWMGDRLSLGAGAVGALLAAVGTAMPESVIPLVAVLSGGGEESHEIAIGAIVGAPFMLATIAMLLVTVSAVVFRGRREQGQEVTVQPRGTRRDLRFFLAVFPLGIVLGAVGAPIGWRAAGAALLIVAYIGYAWRTVKRSGDAEDEDLDPLYLDTSKDDPPNRLQLGLQFALSLTAIVGGAELFVTAIESVSTSLGVPVLVLALVLAPLATELPEKANSVLWMRRGKDMLAVGNITGAMAFQATVPVAMGMLIIPWKLDSTAVVAAATAAAGAALALWTLPRHRGGLAPSAAWASLFAGFVIFVALT